MKLLAAGRAAAIQGRDIGEGLVSLVKKSRAKDIEALDEWLDEWREKQEAKLERAESSGRRMSTEFRDKVECLKSIAAECSTVEQIIGKISRLFDDDPKNKIVLSTVHRAKGLERDRVFVLWDTFKVWKPMRSDNETQQEFYARMAKQELEMDNLRYVAITRARNELYYVA